MPLSESRQKIENLLKETELTFVESDTRMNYGFIGHLAEANSDDKRPIVNIFEKAFYVNSEAFPLNTKTLPLIQWIQLEYAELTRDKNNKIITDKLN